MKKLKFSLKFNFKSRTKGSLWQKALLGVALATFGLMVILSAYLLIKPISKEVKNVIDEEISATDINFDQKTIDNIKARQVPSEIPTITSGKNPFTPF
jgi:flagellar motor component MotA